MGTSFMPNYAVHPGVFLREEMESMKISQKMLSEKIGVSKTIINEVLKGKRKINGELAVKLEGALYSPAHYWLNLQALYDETTARIKLKQEANKTSLQSELGKLAIIFVNDYITVGSDRKYSSYHSKNNHRSIA